MREQPNTLLESQMLVDKPPMRLRLAAGPPQIRHRPGQQGIARCQPATAPSTVSMRVQMLQRDLLHSCCVL
jgi:hypothetical protein